ncbi:hypothetical protein [Bacillus cereus]|uniref:hypothetical protein n=1 Tax=Bacillus cereus TaxID=1396 RepID=UPI00211F3DFC|nr:hypothetical protein [Bacillus cereus]
MEKVLTSPDFLIELATNLKNEQEERKLAESKVVAQQVVYAEHQNKGYIDTNFLYPLIMRDLSKNIFKLF